MLDFSGRLWVLWTELPNVKTLYPLVLMAMDRQAWGAGD